MDGTGTDWTPWIQGIAGNVINAATAAKYAQPYELQRAQIQAQAANPGLHSNAVVSGGIPLSLLLIGGAIVAFIILKD